MVRTISVNSVNSNKALKLFAAHNCVSIRKKDACNIISFSIDRKRAAERGISLLSQNNCVAIVYKIGAVIFAVKDKHLCINPTSDIPDWSDYDVTYIDID